MLKSVFNFGVHNFLVFLSQLHMMWSNGPGPGQAECAIVLSYIDIRPPRITFTTAWKRGNGKINLATRETESKPGYFDLSLEERI